MNTVHVIRVGLVRTSLAPEPISNSGSSINATLIQPRVYHVVSVPHSDGPNIFLRAIERAYLLQTSEEVDMRPNPQTAWTVAGTEYVVTSQEVSTLASAYEDLEDEDDDVAADGETTFGDNASVKSIFVTTVEDLSSQINSLQGRIVVMDESITAGLESADKRIVGVQKAVSALRTQKSNAKR